MYRFYLTIGEVTTEVNPLGFNTTSLVDELEKGQVFYRRKFQGSLVFYGDDFDILWVVELSNPCEKIELLIERKNGATWHTYWEGYFSTTDGEIDLDRCTFKVTPKADDIYMPFITGGDIQYNILDITTVITTQSSYYSFTRNRLLIDVIEFIADKIVPGITVVSDFLTNETNPVTGKVNKYNHITIAQKSDIKTPTSSNPATRAMLSFSELMQILRMFELRWDIVGGVLTIEHVSYFGTSPGLDLRTAKLSVSTNKYKYLKEDMPQIEQFSFMEAYYDDFVGLPIRYDSICTASDSEVSTREYAVRVTTDLDYIRVKVDDIADDGFVLIANYIYNGDYYVHFDVGILSGYVQDNIPLSWASLHDNFFRHERVLITGYLNDNLETFYSAQKNKIQELFAKVCYADNYDPNDWIATTLGDLFSEKARVYRAELRPSGDTSFTLVYGADATEPPPVDDPVLLWIEVVEPEGYNGELFATLSRPVEYDVIFWVEVEIMGTSCEQVLIPAGELEGGFVFQEGGILKFNLSHPSLDDLTISSTYTIVETTECTPDPAVVTVNSIAAIADGTQGEAMSISINYTNTGDGNTATILWRIKDSLTNVVDSGSVLLYFAVGTANKAILGIVYPNEGNDYTLEVKENTQASYVVSNQFDADDGSEIVPVSSALSVSNADDQSDSTIVNVVPLATLETTTDLIDTGDGTDWLEITQGATAVGSFTLEATTLSANAGAERSCILRISDDNGHADSVDVTFTQAAGLRTLELSESQLNFDSTNVIPCDLDTVSVDATQPWYVIVTGDSLSFDLDVTAGGSGITDITVEYIGEVEADGIVATVTFYWTYDDEPTGDSFELHADSACI